MDRCSAGTSMLSGDKVLFFTKPPSVAQARPIRRQWLVNSSQSGGKPRRDRGNGVILLMNYLSGQNNNVLSPFHSSSQTSLFLLFLFTPSPLFYPVPIRYLSKRNRGNGTHKFTVAFNLDRTEWFDIYYNLRKSTRGFSRKLVLSA